MYVLTMLMKFLRYKQLLTMTLRYLHDSLSGPGVDKLLHLKITLLNSSSENSIHVMIQSL